MMDNEAEDRKQVKYLVEIGDGELDELIRCNEPSELKNKKEMNVTHLIKSRHLWLLYIIKEL